MATTEELLRAAMNAEKAGDLAARDGLVKAAEALMGQGAAPQQQASTAPDVQVFPGSAEAAWASPPTPQPDRFGDTIAKATAGPIAATKAFAGGLAEQSNSPTMAALPEGMPMGVKRPIAAIGDAGGMVLSGLGSGIAFGAGLIGETFGGSPTNEKKLARDLLMGSQVAVPELAGVSGATLAARAAAPRAVAPLTRGQEAARATEALGITPSLGMTGKTGAMVAAGLEKVPFAGSIIARDATRAVEAVEGAFSKAVGRIGVPQGARGAGERLQAGLGVFVDSFKKKSAELYGRVDPLMPKDTKVAITETARAIEGPKAVFRDNPALAKKLGLNEWDTIVAEAEKNGLTWDGIKQFRSSVGKAVGQLKGPLADEDAGRLKQLYAALTADMEAAARAAGPKAYKAWRTANGHYKAGAERIDRYLDKAITADTPERAFEVFSAAAKADRATSDVNRMRAIKSSMDENEWNTVSASIIDRLGKAKPGQQNAEGDAFSASTFMTQWNTLSAEAKSLLVPTDVRTELDQIAKVAERLKAGGAERNTSNTGTVATQTATGAGLMAAPGTTISLLAGANITARALTSPVFLKAVNAAQKGNRRALENLARGTSPLAGDARAILGVAAAGQADAANTSAAPVRAIRANP